MTKDVREFWDAQAASFDEEPDHGLLDPGVRAAWAEVLLPEMPRAPARVVDLGCGTGSVTLLLARAGHDVHGVDLSDGMVAAARAKVGASARVSRGDAADPLFEPASVDVVFARHVLWALPDPDTALARWVRLLRPGSAGPGRGSVVHRLRDQRRQVPRPRGTAPGGGRGQAVGRPRAVGSAHLGRAVPGDQPELRRDARSSRMVQTSELRAPPGAPVVASRWISVEDPFVVSTGRKRVCGCGSSLRQRECRL